ncbi:hypothetical protein B0H13DRAFT_2339800 [Mycena leptocephala]|nr:hypothetical protein B0H13DRAFT_2339800 [Mycena leptocephala]
MMKTASLLCGLPVEIIGIICDFSKTPDLISFCQTNRRIHSVCFRSIYRSVKLNNPARVVRFCQTLTLNIFYAQEVRMLDISCYPKYPLGRFAAVLLSAISNLQNLETLVVYTHPSIFACFSDAHFPCLRTCAIPFWVSTDSFVRRHPELSSLSVLPDVDYWHNPSSLSLKSIYMPWLRTFFGPETFALEVVPHSRASHLSIWWNTPRLLLQNSAADIATLALSSANILVLENFIGVWDTSLLSAIAAGLPHLTKLEFCNISAPDPDILQIFISHLDAAVGRLSSLTSLSIFQSPIRPPGCLNPRDLDGEFDVVRRWGDISLTLRSAVLPSETAWARVHLRENVCGFSAWLSPPFDLCPGYATVAEAVAGQDTVALLRATVEREGRIPDFEITPTATGMSITFVSLG